MKISKSAEDVAREFPYYEGILNRMIADMNNDFFKAHQYKLEQLSFLINSHKQDSEIKHGNG